MNVCTLCLGAAALLVAGCSAREDAAPPNVATDSVHVAPKRTVDEFGIGALRAGMTLREANTVLDGGLSYAAPADSAGCTYAKWSGAPVGVYVMMDAGRVARIEVRTGTIETADGARIGDSEGKVKGLYAGRVEEQPAKYGTGHSLVVTPSSPGDTAFRMVFETEKDVVTKYRAGKRPQVEFVEGCG